MHYEHYCQPLLLWKKWIRRVVRSVWMAAALAGIALTIGVLGYHFLAHLPWVDSILEASMILAGMGPVAPMTTTTSKLFASGYALLSGLCIIGTTSIILAPWVHRLLHCFYEERRRGGSHSGTEKRRK